MRPHSVPVTRDDVLTWLLEFKKSKKGQKHLRPFLEAKLAEQNLDGASVSTVDHQDLGDETPLIEMIISDLESYGV